MSRGKRPTQAERQASGLTRVDLYLPADVAKAVSEYAIENFGGRWTPAIVGALRIALLLALCACGSPGNHYTAHIDPSFSVTEQEQIVAAVDRWTAQIPELKVDVEIGPCSGVHDGQICVHKSDHATVVKEGHDGEIGCTRNGSGPFGAFVTDGGETWIDTTGAESDPDHPWVFSWLAAHEMGHSMGLSHTSKGQLMAPFAGWAGSDRVTADDRAQWYSIRGMVAK